MILGGPLTSWTKITGAFRKGGALCCKHIYMTSFNTVVLILLFESMVAKTYSHRNGKMLRCNESLIKAIYSVKSYFYVQNTLSLFLSFTSGHNTF